MKVIHTVFNLNMELQKHKSKRIGFVPTMGSLHEGHISLVKHAVQKTDFVIVSIFVNPTQFNDASDYNNYPSNHNKDLNKLINEKIDVVFIPESVEELYNHESPIKVDFQGVDEVMEGKHRSGHFDGVVRVLNILFTIIKPNFAFFGEKDFQQLLVVKAMSNRHFQQIKIIGCPTKRDDSGLAMSSRNLLLKQQEKSQAVLINNILKEAKSMFQTNSHDSIEKYCFSKLKEFSIPEYFEIREDKNLKKVKDKTTKQRAFVATTLGKIRLIDNIELN